MRGNMACPKCHGLGDFYAMGVLAAECQHGAPPSVWESQIHYVVIPVKGSKVWADEVLAIALRKIEEYEDLDKRIKNVTRNGPHVEEKLAFS